MPTIGRTLREVYLTYRYGEPHEDTEEDKYNDLDKF